MAVDLHRIDHGWKGVLSPDGHYIAHGYEQLHVLNPRTHATKACPFAGTQYLAGWMDAEHVAFMSDFKVYTWDIETDEITEQPIPAVMMSSVWYAGGRQYFLSGTDLWLDGQFTLGGVSGLVAEGDAFLYGSYPDYDRTIVRDAVVPTLVLQTLKPLRPWAGPHDVGGQVWVATAYEGAEVIAPDGERKVVAGEGRGPIVGIPGGETICFSVFQTGTSFDAIGRPWEAFALETPGYYVPDIGHQGLTAMACEDGILVCGWKDDSTATMAYAIIPYDEARVVRPGQPSEPPVEPPTEPPSPGGPVTTNEELMEKLVQVETKVNALDGKVNALVIALGKTHDDVKARRLTTTGIPFLGTAQGEIKPLP